MTQGIPFRRRRLIPFLALGLAAGAGTLPAAAQRIPLTAPERTDFRETTRYADAMEILEAVAAASPLIHLETMGYTMEGRAMPLAVVGHVRDGSAAAVRATGRTRVLLQGGIHSGEVEGKEVLLRFLREVAEGQHTALLDSLVILINPIYNADGNESVLLTNRRGQHGPVGGMGTRPNSQGLNLNRDYTKVESPAARSMGLTLAAYDPHVGVDLHTTNGTRHAYHLTYAPPLHPNTPGAIDALLRERWLPELTEAVREKHGWHFYHYGNVQGRGEDAGWYTFDYKPRFSNNYLGLRNRFGILSEAYAYATFEDRIAATWYFVEEVLAFSRTHATELRRITEELDATPVVGQRLALRAEPAPSPAPVEILMGEVTQERNPYSGELMSRRLDVVNPQMMTEYIGFRGTETERVPEAYLIPPGPAAADALDRLGVHGVTSTILDAPRTLQVERFRIDSTMVGARPFETHLERTVWGAWESATVELPAGTAVVSARQPLGRLLFTLLEPRSDDGFLHWNVLDRGVEDAAHYPILRTHERGVDGPGMERVELETALGSVLLEVDGVRAPRTAANFLRYVDAGLYAGGRIHRTVTPANQPDNDVKIEVIQGGRRPDTQGFDRIPLERTTVTGLTHVDGALSMARSGPDTAVSDFFIAIGPQHSLDFGGARNPDGQGFAAFGRVVDGMEVVRRIQAAPAEGQRLTPAVEIVAARRVR